MGGEVSLAKTTGSVPMPEIEFVHTATAPLSRCVVASVTGDRAVVEDLFSPDMIMMATWERLPLVAKAWHWCM